jgi:tRNA nucleotidyltransferase (CCA-adding enzyme)
MLRAARLESRMDFHLDPHSEELIDDALPLLKRVSGARVRHELDLIFRESEPERALRRLQDLGVLAHIHPDLHCDKWLREKYQTLREHLTTGDWRLTTGYWPYLALLAYRLGDESLRELSARLMIKRDDAEDLHLLHNLKEAVPQLRKARRPSAIYCLLQPYPTRVLAVAWVAVGRKQLRERLLRYQTEYRLVETELTGDDLKAMGLEPGPSFRHLLGALRDARLDGEVSTREEEKALLKKLLATNGKRGNREG